MRFISSLHPQRILQALDEIDASGNSYSMSRPQGLRRVFITLACVCVALLFIHYAKFSSNIPLLIGDELTQRWQRSEEHTSELQSREKLVCRLLLEKTKHTLRTN